jgi:major membrane immunogen (membrane-anchored lipoprotein)
MIPDGTYTAVVDRFEDELAVLEVSGENERYEHALDRTDLPEDARHADAVLVVDIQDGNVVAARYEAEETDTRADDAQSRFDRLSKRLPDSDDPE